MNKAIAKRWAAALRSDKYKQGQGCLKKKENDGTASHCCLGVLTELYQASMRRQGKRGLKERQLSSNMIAFSSIPSTSCHNGAAGETALLLPAVVKWARMQSSAGDYPLQRALHRSGCSGSLARDNDCGKSFKQIARIIETHWEAM